ncbi:cation:proton antiporter [Trujillonella endophytica]|uniref:Sodium/proton antiporter, CPA1 family n=1 Tax=Trujillonella endophytica TaxID=673521 RepID=A0A1H8QN79_9ACTN|nr:cation:proton antiporter [Trujillella endophytica]SEO55451.1 sodium/proton antiporter, CPA1 family [Trujillella endophytica]
MVESAALTTVAAAIFLWGVGSARLERADVTGPIVFVLVGSLMAGTGMAGGTVEPETVRPLVEIALVWVLFSDAARVRLHDLREEAGRCARLLGLGLPLTVLFGWALAAWLFPDMGGWLALLVGAALAPTDAALGVSVVTDPAVPSRIRRLITVESGLNDGIVTPVVVVALAGAASAEGLAQSVGLAEAVVELAVGAAVGAAVGTAGGLLLRAARSRGWAAEEFVGVAVLALAGAAYAAALVAHGNGFVGAFCGGLAFGATAGRRGPAELRFTEEAGALVTALVWLVFGAVAVPVLLDRADGATMLYAVLSLSLLRMVPVALATLGTAMDARTVLFVGWFGPRGLASLVFALLALEELGPAAEDAVAVITATVLLSVVVHGISAAPLAARYGRSAAGRGAVTPRG